MPSEPTEAAVAVEDDEFRLDLLTLAEWALIAPDGRVTLGNAMTSVVQVNDLPAGLPSLYLVASIVAPPAWAGQQAQLAVRALDADGQPVAADPLVSGAAIFPPRPDEVGRVSRVQFALQLTGLQIRTTGRLQFVLSLAGDELGQVDLTVVKTAPSTPPAQAAP